MAAVDNKFPERILVVDDDAAITTMVCKWLRDKGVRTVTGLNVPESAWAESLSRKYQMIILDWNLGQQLSGVGLFNRWKLHEHYRDVPVFVISGYLSELDFAILDEYPLTEKSGKPLDPQLFLSTVSHLHQKAEWYRKQQQNIDAMIRNINNGDMIGKLDSLMSQSPDSYDLCCAIAIALYNSDHLEEAQQVFEKAAQLKKDSVLVLNFMGKIALKQGRHRDAKQFLSTALKKSPDNVERLCNLGDICLHDMEIDKANALFSKALDVDEASKRASSGKHVSRQAINWMEQFNDIPTSFASLLNNMAISLVRSGSFQDGISHYKNALKIVLNNQLRSKLCFNIGMAYIRWKKNKDGIEWFLKSMNHDPLFKKAEIYRDKVRDLMSVHDDVMDDDHNFDDFSDDDFISGDFSDDELQNELDLGYSMEADPEDMGPRENDPLQYSRLDEERDSSDDFSDFKDPDEEDGAPDEMADMIINPYLCNVSSSKMVSGFLLRTTVRTIEFFTTETLSENDKYEFRISDKSIHLHLRSTREVNFRNKDQNFVRMICADPNQNVSQFLKKNIPQKDRIKEAS
ncbi:MAG: tetratricopeptide repeat protein [Deltaproteobacteria bacterium]|nr:tetratricopeptide repeat protein [Deltaproteobacteria bacterium]